jgi:hypothetical protein
MISDDRKYLKESRSIIEKAFDFQDYIYRRTFGLYYLGWAVAFFLYTLPGLVYPFFFGNIWIIPVFYVSSTLIIMLVTGYIFSKAFRVSKIFTQRPRQKTWSIPILLFLVIMTILILLVGMGPLRYLVLLYVILAFSVPWMIVFTIRKSMIKFHPETWTALIVFIIACVISIAAVEMQTYLVLTVTWLFVSITWAACGIIGLYNAYFQSVMITDDE